MATQPIPAIGSVTFFIHLIIIVINKLININKIVLIGTPIAFIILFTSFYFIRNNYRNNFQPIENKVIVNKHLNEKTELITDTSFIKNAHFSAWIPWWDESRVIDSLKNAPNGSIEVISP